MHQCPQNLDYSKEGATFLFRKELFRSLERSVFSLDVPVAANSLALQSQTIAFRGSLIDFTYKDDEPGGPLSPNLETVSRVVLPDKFNNDYSTCSPTKPCSN